MATYIVLGKFTDKGRQGVKDSPDRRREGRERAKALGVTFQSYVTMGRYDVVWVVDAPDEASMAKWLLGVGKFGALTTETLRGFSEAEADALFATI